MVQLEMKEPLDRSLVESDLIADYSAAQTRDGFPCKMPASGNQKSALRPIGVQMPPSVP